MLYKHIQVWLYLDLLINKYLFFENERAKIIKIK